MSDTSQASTDQAFEQQLHNGNVDTAAPASNQQQNQSRRSDNERTGHFPATHDQKTTLMELLAIAGEEPAMSIQAMTRTQASREMKRLFRNENVRQSWAEQSVQPDQIGRLNQLYSQLDEAGLAHKADTSEPASKLDAADRIDEFQALLRAGRYSGPFSL